MDVVWKKPKASSLVQACQLCFATLGKGCSQSVTCPVHAGGNCSTRAEDGKKELAKRGWQLHKGVTRASASLVGAIKISINNTEYMQVADSLQSSACYGTLTPFSSCWKTASSCQKKIPSIFSSGDSLFKQQQKKSFYYREIRSLECF